MKYNGLLLTMFDVFLKHLRAEVKNNSDLHENSLENAELHEKKNQMNRKMMTLGSCTRPGTRTSSVENSTTERSTNTC